MAVAWLAAHGLEVWLPASDHHRADMGVVVDGKLLRVQVRTATYLPARRRYRARLTRRVGARAVPYAVGEVDFFLIVCPIHPEPALYLIPAGDIGSRSSATLRPQGTTPTVRGDRWEQYRDAVHLLRNT
jgi:hypothetical protein